MTVHFIRCSDRSYQAFCPQHDESELTLFWDVVEGSLYCTTCGLEGQLQIVSMPGHVTPPELFSMRVQLMAANTEEN